MKYASLKECVEDLKKNNDLIIVNEAINPYLALGSIQRRAFRKKAPAILFTNVLGTPFPVLANLYGTKERIHFIFRSSLANLKALLSIKANPARIKDISTFTKALPAVWNTRIRIKKQGALLEGRTTLQELPQVHSWKMDGGAYITLPQVYTENPESGGYLSSNLGMYRVQISGNDFIQNKEVGLHYQIHRGIAGHHSIALAHNKALPVNIFIGGTPALTLASIMPLPENVPELAFAGALAGFRIPFVPSANGLIMPADADFCISGYITNAVKEEGPFGDHIGYYSLQHPFPVMNVTQVYCKKDAIFPFTTVGRPPQEDTLFGDFIHEITEEIIPREFVGVKEVHAVDCAGVHPLLLAIAHERYVPYSTKREPEEIITTGLSLLGRSQMSLAKYLFVVCYEDSPNLSTKDIPHFMEHVLERTHFNRDLHFITKTTIDTLDYTGADFNRGSKLLWVVAGDICRKLATEIPSSFTLAQGFRNAKLFHKGILVIEGQKSTAQRGEGSKDMEELVQFYEYTKGALEGIALCLVVDDATFTSASWENFLWVWCTRSNPATDVYGLFARTRNKHFEFEAPCCIDARIKPFHAPALEDDEETETYVDEYIAHNRILMKYLG